MTQEFVTLPREVVERALEALLYEKDANAPLDWCHDKEIKALRAALEHPQNHIPGVRNMVPAGWKLVPEKLTQHMADAAKVVDGRLSVWKYDDAYRAMLAVAPQPPTTEQSSAVQQPQVEQDPVAWIWAEWSNRKLTFDGPPAVPSVRDELTKPAWTPLYTRPQRERQPLSTARIDELIEEGIFGGNPYELVRRLEEERGVFMTRPLTDEQISRLWSDAHNDTTDRMAFQVLARAIEASHNIK